MEKDDEVSGQGNTYDFGARLNNVRLGRWFTTDKLAILQPEWSPYKVNKNNPIMYKDPDGNKEIVFIKVYDKQTGITDIYTNTASDVIFSRRRTEIESHSYAYYYDWYDKQTIHHYTKDEFGNIDLDYMSEELVNFKEKNHEPLVTTAINSQWFAKSKITALEYADMAAPQLHIWGDGDVSTSIGSKPDPKRRVYSINLSDLKSYMSLFKSQSEVDPNETQFPTNSKEALKKLPKFLQKVVDKKGKDIVESLKEQTFGKQKDSSIHCNFCNDNFEKDSTGKPTFNKSSKPANDTAETH